MKPSTSLADPYPAPTVLPKLTQQDNTGDYESEMVIVIGRDAKDVSESEALDYVLGYTAANDVSSRTFQMNQSQWCFSKGFDGACPIGKSHKILHFIHCADRANRPRPRLGRSRAGRNQAADPRPEKWPGHAGLPAHVRDSQSSHSTSLVTLEHDF